MQKKYILLNIKQIRRLNFVLFCFVVAVGAILLWQLARFRCGSWRNSVVAVGEMLLGNIVLLYLRTFSKQIGKEHFEGIAKHFEVATKRRIVT